LLGYFGETLKILSEAVCQFGCRSHDLSAVRVRFSKAEKEARIFRALRHEADFWPPRGNKQSDGHLLAPRQRPLCKGVVSPNYERDTLMPKDFILPTYVVDCAALT
jgi:hypothetical protein